jgi:hypothetical protein
VSPAGILTIGPDMTITTTEAANRAWFGSRTGLPSRGRR